jgi:hypothetical protein
MKSPVFVPMPRATGAADRPFRLLAKRPLGLGDFHECVVNASLPKRELLR